MLAARTFSLSASLGELTAGTARLLMAAAVVLFFIWTLFDMSRFLGGGAMAGDEDFTRLRPRMEVMSALRGELLLLAGDD